MKRWCVLSILALVMFAACDESFPHRVYWANSSGNQESISSGCKDPWVRINTVQRSDTLTVIWVCPK
jgi:hypothetical protein